MKKPPIPQDLQRWIDARNRYRLSHAQVQMARELGLNPKKFGGYANHEQEQWKIPLGQYIEHLYRKRFGRDQPEIVRSIEEKLKEDRRKNEARRTLKMERRQSALTTGLAWYSREQWELLKRVADDVEALDDSYEEWRNTAEEAMRNFTEQGIRIAKVEIDVEEARAWCQAKGIPFNSEGRAHYIGVMLRQSQRTRES